MPKNTLMPTNRLPIEPLMQWFGIDGVSDFARFIGLSRWTVHRLKKNGLTGWQADELAIKRAHIHPYLVWGEAFNNDQLWVESTREFEEAA